MSRVDNIWSAIAYIPPLGWYFTMYIKRKSEFCQFHAKQGFLLMAFTLIALFSFYIFSFLIPDFFGIFKMGMYILIITTYIIISLWGFVSATKGQEKPLPIVGKYVKRLLL